MKVIQKILSSPDPPDNEISMMIKESIEHGQGFTKPHKRGSLQEYAQQFCACVMASVAKSVADRIEYVPVPFVDCG